MSRKGQKMRRSMTIPFGRVAFYPNSGPARLPVRPKLDACWRVMVPGHWTNPEAPPW